MNIHFIFPLHIDKSSSVSFAFKSPLPLHNPVISQSPQVNMQREAVKCQKETVTAGEPHNRLQHAAQETQVVYYLLHGCKRERRCNQPRIDFSPSHDMGIKREKKKKQATCINYVLAGGDACQEGTSTPPPPLPTDSGLVPMLNVAAWTPSLH